MLIKERTDLQCRFYDTPSSQAVRVWDDPGQVVLVLRPLARIQSERLQSSVCKQHREFEVRTRYSVGQSTLFKRDCAVESGTRWASLVQASFLARVDCDARMGMEKNGLILSFITEVSWTRKNGHAR